MSNDEKVTLHLEYDEEMDESVARSYAKDGPDYYLSPANKARARAARELFPEYKYEVGRPYEVTFGDSRHSRQGIVRLLYRVEGGWGYNQTVRVWGDRDIRSARPLAFGEEV